MLHRLPLGWTFFYEVQFYYSTLLIYNLCRIKLLTLNNFLLFEISNDRCIGGQRAKISESHHSKDTDQTDLREIAWCPHRERERPNFNSANAKYRESRKTDAFIKTRDWLSKRTNEDEGSPFVSRKCKIVDINTPLLSFFRATIYRDNIIV